MINKRRSFVHFYFQQKQIKINSNRSTIKLFNVAMKNTIGGISVLPRHFVFQDIERKLDTALYEKHLADNIRSKSLRALFPSSTIFRVSN